MRRVPGSSLGERPPPVDPSPQDPAAAPAALRPDLPGPLAGLPRRPPPREPGRDAVRAPADRRGQQVRVRDPPALLPDSDSPRPRRRCSSSPTAGTPPGRLPGSSEAAAAAGKLDRLDPRSRLRPAGAAGCAPQHRRRRARRNFARDADRPGRVLGAARFRWRTQTAAPTRPEGRQSSTPRQRRQPERGGRPVLDRRGPDPGAGSADGRRDRAGGCCCWSAACADGRRADSRPGATHPCALPFASLKRPEGPDKGSERG